VSSEDEIQGWNALAETIHKETIANGFYDAYGEMRRVINRDGQTSPGGKNLHLSALHLMVIGQKAALVGSELGEMIDAFRKPKPSEKIPDYAEAEEEMADTIIRLLDLAAFAGMDLEGAMRAKLAYNRGRAYQHGGKAF
jgi:NTP pyrophosphatase (non-canonical NTP hydrolase)